MNEHFANFADRMARENRERGQTRATRRAMDRLLLGLLFALALAGCGSDDGARPATAGPAPPPSSARPDAATHGHFVGTVTIGDRDYYGDALLTVDGLIRLYVGGGDASSGAVQQSRPEDSVQFTGSVDIDGDQASGEGVIIGQACAVPDTGGFCGETASGVISIRFAAPGLDPGELQGEIRVTTSEGDETWLLDLTAWNNFYELPASSGAVAGQYREELAEFAKDDDDVIISVDSAGQLFFQGAQTGCTGNGTLAPHLDGEFNVYDVALTIDSCNASHAHLNGEYAGLATQSPSSYWDYDSWLRIWLSTRDGTSSQAAVTTWGRPL